MSCDGCDALQVRVEELTEALMANAHTINGLTPDPWAYTTQAEMSLRRVLDLLPPSPFPSPPDFRISCKDIREIITIIKGLGHIQ